MRYVENAELKFDATDFGARVVNGALEIPTVLFQALEHGRCHGDLLVALSLLASFPTSIGSKLKLSPEGIKSGLLELLKKLDGHMDAELLAFLRSDLDGTRQRPKYAFGALPPPNARHKPGDKI
jgi:hypothetical protein